MTIITINQTYRITSDPHQWRVEMFKGRGKKARWEPISYHTTLWHAVEGLVQHRMRHSKAKDFLSSGTT